MKTAYEDARRAVEFLEHHQLEPTAVNYELAFTCISDPVSELARDVNVLTDGGLRLTQEAAAGLADQYLCQAPNAAVRRRERTVTRQAEELGALTSGAHDLTSALGRDVGTIVAGAQDWPPATDNLVSRLSHAEQDLAELRSEFVKLQSQIGTAERERGDTSRDELTQALNQSGATAMFEPMALYDRGYVMILFSLDNLIALNDRFGRSVGDNVLNALAATLRQVFPDQELIRWAGNEFVIMMKDTALLAARTLAQDALTAMEARRLKLRGSGEAIGVVTASAGLALGQGEPATAVLQRARAHALEAAASGGNRFEG